MKHYVLYLVLVVGVSFKIHSQTDFGFKGGLSITLFNEDNGIFGENPESFSIVHSDIVKNCFLREYVIRDLPIRQKCYVRISAGNMCGFGPSTIANPPYCVPSS